MDEFDDVDDTTPDRFGKLAPSRRAHLGKRRVWEAEWKTRELEAGGLIAQLRSRAESARRWAFSMLAVLVAIGLIGTTLFLSDFLSSFVGDADKAQRQALVRVAEESQAELRLASNQLDARLAAERDGIAKSVLSEFISDPNRPPSMTVTLYDVHFGPSGEALIIGDQGTILTREAGEVVWRDASIPSIPVSLWAARFGPSGEAIIAGDNGTILTRATDSVEWRDASLQSVTSDFLDVGFGPDGEAVIVGWKGAILTRAAGDVSWRDVSMPSVDAALLGVRFGPSGEALAFGSNGTILSRSPGQSKWRDAPLPTAPSVLYNIRFSPDGEAVAVGHGGAILSLAAGGTTWRDVSLPTVPASLLDVRFGPSGEAVIIGDDGTILTRAPDEEIWRDESLPSVPATLLDIRFGPSGKVVVVGQGGTILTRDAGETTWRDASHPSVSTTFYNSRVSPAGEIVIVGSKGSIFARAPSADSIKSSASEADLIGAVAQLGPYRDRRIWIERLQRLQSQRTAIETEEAAIRQEKEAAEKGLLTQGQRLTEMREFLAGCLTQRDARSAEAISACREAYLAATKNTSLEFYANLANRIAPAALVLFLLVTLGGAYRYNMRLATFLHARADALEAAGLNVDKSRMESLTVSFSADGMQFRESRMPTDAVVDIAKETASKLSSKG